MALRRMTAWVAMLLMMAAVWAQPALACRLACASQRLDGRTVGQMAGQMAAHAGHSCCPSSGHGRAMATAQRSGLNEQVGAADRGCDGIVGTDTVPCGEEAAKLTADTAGRQDAPGARRLPAIFGEQVMAIPAISEGRLERDRLVRLDRERARLLTTRIQV